MNETTKASTTVLVKVRELHPAPWNPVSRTSLARIKSLASSMERVGQQVPILIAMPSKMIIEGHRRWAAAQYLEWNYLEAKVVEDANAEQIYAEVNSESRKLTGSDALCVWLENRSAVTPTMCKAFDRISNVIGVARVRKIAKAGLSARVYRTAAHVSAFCDIEDVGKIVDWLVRYSGAGMIGQVMKAIEAGTGRNAIINAIEQDKPVKVTLE